MEGHVELI